MIWRLLPILQFLVFAGGTIFGLFELQRSQGLGLVFIVGGIGGMVLTAVLDAKRARRVRRSADEAEARRLRELLSAAARPDFHLVVHGPSGLRVAMLGLVFASGMTYAGVASGRWDFLSFGTILGYATLVMLLRALPRQGQAILELSTGGFRTPQCGWIPWSAVNGIDALTETGGGAVVTFTTREISPYLSQMHPLERLARLFLLGAGRNRIPVLLTRSRPTPATVRVLAGHLHAGLGRVDGFVPPRFRPPPSPPTLADRSHDGY